MPHVAELGLLAGGFAEQPGIGVGGRGMRIVPALLAMEVALPYCGPPRWPPAFARGRACGPPSARSSSCWPRLRSACRRRKSVRWRAGCGLAAGSERSQRTWPRYHRRAADLGFCRRRWHPTPDRPPRAQRTSGTTDCSQSCSINCRSRSHRVERLPAATLATVGSGGIDGRPSRA